MRQRGFVKVSAYKDADFPLPERKTKFSAGYDFCLPEAVTLEPGKITLVPTGIKAYMQPGEFLGLHIRSSMAVKKGLLLVNSVGIIDADYYDNPENEGHILLALLNTKEEALTLPKGERVAQGIFYNFLLADGDEAQALRSGGIGSTKS